MKRHNVLFVLLVASLMGATAKAQQRSPNPQGQQQQTDTIRRVQVRELPVVRGNVLDLLNVLPGLSIGGAWWTNTNLVTRLGLTDDQKAKIERAFENHRQKLESTTQQLQKEEAQLARLLEAESIDRNAILTQIDRVILARVEVERENSAMTLEMREYLTRAQWMQLPMQPTVTWLTGGGPYIRGGGQGGRGAPTTVEPGATPGARGQRGGGQRQQ